MEKNKMKKLFFITTILAIPFSAFTMQMRWEGSRWAVDGQVTSIRQWGGQIYEVYCQNPYDDTVNQRWVIVYEN